MNKKKTKILIASLLAIVLAGGAMSLALLKDTSDVLTNIFSKSEKYTLEYHANASGENVTVPAMQESYGEGKFVISSEKPVRNDFVFTGWNLKEDGSGASVTPGSTYTTTERHTDVYAQWSTGYTVEYHANGGTGAPVADTKESTQSSETFNIKGPGSMVYKTTVGGKETTEAKVFIGWSTDPKAKEPEYTANGKYAYTGEDFDGDVSKDDFERTITLQSSKRKVTLYAVWATRYKLIFDANKKYNGTGNVPPTQTKVSTKDEWPFDIIENNDDNDDPAITPKRTDENKGYRFGWWCDNPDSRTDGPGTYQYGDKGVVVYNETAERFRTDPWRVLYAIYKPPKTLGLAYDPNGGSGDFKVYWASVLTDKQLVDIDPNPKKEGEAKNPTRTNYIFMGWSKDKNRKQNLEVNTDPAKRLKDGDFETGDKIQIDIWEDSRPTLYAVWRCKHKFRLQFDLNGGSTGYYKDDNGTWRTNTSTRGMYYESPWLNTKEEIINEYEWPASHFETHGVYATRADDATHSYKFLGWHMSDKSLSTAEANALTAEDVDYEVTLPSDPSNPGQSATGTQGCITEAIKLTEKKERCTTSETHYTYMYAVWDKTPLHSYKVIFTNKDIPNNSNLAGVSIVNKVNGSTLNESESASSTKPIISTKGNNIKSNYTVYGKKFEKNSLPISTSPSATWGVDEICTSSVIPYATKTPTATERYELKGWSYEPNSQTVDVPINKPTGELLGPITIDDPNPTTCEGDIHYLLLFPVFDTVAQHTYNLYMVPNYTTLSGYSKTLRYKYNASGSMTNADMGTYKGIVDINGRKHENPNASGTDQGYYAAKFTSRNQEISVDSWGSGDNHWRQGSTGQYHLLDHRLIISCTKNSSASASAPDFKFLGWSYNRNNKDLDKLDATDVDVAVDTREKIDDPANPGQQIANPNYGMLLDDIVLSEADVTDTDSQCETTKGYEHNMVLYGVWQSDKAHQYTVVFSGVLDGAKIFAKNTSGEFKEQSVKTISKITDFEGNEVTNIKRAWECDSPPEKLETDTDHGYKWTATEWADIGVYAEKDKDAKYKYNFKGWSTNPTNKNPEELVESDVNVHMDTAGKLIIDDVEITDNDIDNCPGNIKHYDVLYAVWEREPIPATHTFTVKFNGNSYFGGYSGTSYKYYDSASSSWKTSTDSKYGTYATEELQVSTNKKYDFDANYWSTRGLSATKNNTYTNSFDFVGWSYGREGISPQNLTRDEVDVEVDDNGFIKDTITVECKDDACEDGKHEVTLYAIYELKPLTKTYTLKFDLNTEKGEEELASNKPDDMEGSEIYGATNPGAWVNSYTFTLPDNSDTANLPVYKKMAFVGWSENKNAMPGEYGYEYGNPELNNTTKDLKNNYKMAAANNYNSSPTTKTLYAIWAYEYQMTYDPNDGYSGPSMEHEYTNQASHNYTMSENYPSRNGYKFLGWADSPDATEPDYYPNSSIFGNDKPKVKEVEADPSGSTKLRVYAVWQKD